MFSGFGDTIARTQQMKKINFLDRNVNNAELHFYRGSRNHQESYPWQ